MKDTDLRCCLPRLLLSLAASILAVSSAAAQTADRVASMHIDPAPPPLPATYVRAADGRTTVRAVRLGEPIQVDGGLDEEIYQAIQPATNFIQQDPQSGEPATEQTEVWVFFDERQVYISLRCLDSRPDKMVANEMRRDNVNIWWNDNISLVLDTYYDRKNAFYFQTNPLGGVRDALVLDERTVITDWNTVWDTKSQRSDRGWTAEMAIPFKSLRYAQSGPQIWGFNVLRAVRSKNETSLLSPVPRSYGGNGMFKISSAATLVGIEVPVGSRNLEIKPYAISDVTTNRAVSPVIANDLDAAIGVDAKYAVTSSLIADLTYNTDFAQVEIDEQQVNLTRFSLFFPEKRDFFLEGQSVFDFAGTGNSQNSALSELPVLFFTRRIGLAQGQPVPIEVGGRLAGRAGRTSIGVLGIRTDDLPSAKAVATSFAIGRVKRDILGRSSIGLLATHRSRSLTGVGSNQVYGADMSLNFYTNLQINGYYARSETTGLSGDAESYRAHLRYPADRYGLELEHLKVGPAFSPEVGFVRRPDIRRSYVSGRFSPRPKSARRVRKIGWEGTYDYFANNQGVVQSRYVRGTFRVDLQNSDSFVVSYGQDYEFLSTPFLISRGITLPRGGYGFNSWEATYNLGPQHRASGSIGMTVGDFYSGHRTEGTYSGRVKMSAQLAVEPRISLNWVNLQEGRFTTTVAGARVTYTITPRMFTGTLVQYNSSLNTIETNVRFRWEYQPGSDFFIVYTDGRDTTGRRAADLANRGFAVKLTRLLRF